MSKSIAAMSPLTDQLARALESILDSGLLNGLTELHDRVRHGAREALEEYERPARQRPARQRPARQREEFCELLTEENDMNAVVQAEKKDLQPVNDSDSHIQALAKLAAGGASLEVMEQMKGLVEWDEARRAKAEFNKAFSQAKAMFKPAKKTGFNQHLKSHYSTLLDYDEATRDGLGANGLSWRHVPKSLPNDTTSITCILAHKGGHSEEATMEAPSYSMTNNAVNKLQSAGIVSTYLKRMTLASLLGLVSDSEFDNDGNGGTEQETITEHESANLKALADEVKANMPEFLKFFKIEKLEQLPKARLKQASQMLEAKRKKK